MKLFHAWFVVVAVWFYVQRHTICISFTVLTIVFIFICQNQALTVLLIRRSLPISVRQLCWADCMRWQILYMPNKRPMQSTISAARAISVRNSSALIVQSLGQLTLPLNAQYTKWTVLLMVQLHIVYRWQSPHHMTL